MRCFVIGFSCCCVQPPRQRGAGQRGWRPSARALARQRTFMGPVAVRGRGLGPEKNSPCGAALGVSAWKPGRGPCQKMPWLVRCRVADSESKNARCDGFQKDDVLSPQTCNKKCLLGLISNNFNTNAVWRFLGSAEPSLLARPRRVQRCQWLRWQVAATPTPTPAPGSAGRRVVLAHAAPGQGAAQHRAFQRGRVGAGNVVAARP